MARFVSKRDILFFQGINRELISEVIETLVVIYKIVANETPTNIYGESNSKAYYVPTSVAALINRQDSQATSEGFGADVIQQVTFSFTQRSLQEANVYPEVGDLIGWDGNYHQVDNVIENQLLGGQADQNHSIICQAHLTRLSGINILPRNV